jgi:hypothetical protein
MIPSTDEDHAQVEKAADTKALPKLVSYRQKLEREAGQLDVVARRHQILLLVVSAIAGVVTLYALWKTMTAEPPIVTWCIAAGFAIGAAVIARSGSGAERERARDRDVLHDKMRSTGRRIDAAERRLRG